MIPDAFYLNRWVAGIDACPLLTYLSRGVSDPRDFDEIEYDPKTRQSPMDILSSSNISDTIEKNSNANTSFGTLF